MTGVEVADDDIEGRRCEDDGDVLASDAAVDGSMEEPLEEDDAEAV